MKVLLAHTYYDSSKPSGENAAVADEIFFLRSAGVEVQPLTFRSDELEGRPLRGLTVAGSMVLGNRGRWLSILADSNPDVVHMHNTIPYPGPGLALAARQMGIPLVQTVHNRRLAPCLAGTQTLNELPCTKCAGKRFATSGVVHGCYRGNRAQSLVVAASYGLHRTGWVACDHYFAVHTDIASVLLENAGVTPARVSVKANPVADAGVQALPADTTFLFAGRLESAKGFDLVLSAWEQLPPSRQPRLIICGSGDMSVRARVAAERSPSIEFRGMVNADGMLAAQSDASVVLVPSIGAEGLPRAMAEAFSGGRPVVTTPTGPVADLVQHESAGWLMEAPTPEALAALVGEITAAPSKLVHERSEAARRCYDSNYRPDILIAQQLRVYERLMSERSSA